MPQVKRGLEKLYRRVEREVSEEVLEVVWGDMQGCLMQQVAKFNGLIQDCYPGELPHLPSYSHVTDLYCRSKHHSGV